MESELDQGQVTTGSIVRWLKHELASDYFMRYNTRFEEWLRLYAYP